MFFENVPQKYVEHIKALTKDQSFHEKINNDKILDELDDEMFDPAICYAELCSTIGLPINIDGRKFKAVNLLQYVYLWCIGSPLIKSSKEKVTEADLDIFFYTLNNKIEDAVTLSTKALGEIKRLNLDLKTAISIAYTLIDLAFQPLKMFPSSPNEGAKKCEFDTDWLTSMVAKVYSVTGLTPDYIMNNLSLTACCYYYVQWCRMQGAKDIEKRTPEEILKAQSERMDELLADRLIEIGALSEDDKKEFLVIIGTPPPRNDNK